MSWQTEIDELHAFFQAYFLGETSSLDRMDAALAPDFTYAGPDGIVTDRAATMGMVADGHAHTHTLRITTTEHRLLAESPDLLVASYVERHVLTERQNARLSTVVFRRYDDAPNGVRWVRVHETWLERPAD